MDDDVDWCLMDFGDQRRPVKKAAPVPAGPLTACPKCGRALKSRGQHFHLRKCMSVSNADAR